MEAAADLAGFDTLIVGKGALTLTGRAPDISRVRDGLKVIVFEQLSDVLEKRLGFRVAEYGLRWVFQRVPGHPLHGGTGRAAVAELAGRIDAASEAPAIRAWKAVQPGANSEVGGDSGDARVAGGQPRNGGFGAD